MANTMSNAPRQHSAPIPEDHSDSIWQLKRPAIAVDVILFTIKDNDLKVGLIRREEEPYFGKHALPGRFVRYEEPIEETARMALKLKGKVNPEVVYLEQLYAFGQDLYRDTRIRTISIVYYGLVDAAKIDFQKSAFTWHSVYELPGLAFDHAQIIGTAVQRLRENLMKSDLAFQLMPEEFTLTELQKAYEIILHQALDKRNFRKKIMEMGILHDVHKKKMEGVHRPAELYGFVRE